MSSRRAGLHPGATGAWHGRHAQRRPPWRRPPQNLWASIRVWEVERNHLGRSLRARCYTTPNTCAGLALTHRRVVGSLRIRADQVGQRNASSRDAATVQEVVVVIPRFVAHVAAHSGDAGEQHEGCQGAPRRRHYVGNVPRNCRRVSSIGRTCTGSSGCSARWQSVGKSATRRNMQRSAKTARN